MNKKTYFSFLTAFLLLLSVIANADEISVTSVPAKVGITADAGISVVYPGEIKVYSEFPGTTPRPDDDTNVYLMEDISEEAIALTVELYNNFLKFDPDMFLYSDNGLKNYDSLGVMTDEELEYVKQKAVQITEGCTDADEKIWAVAEYVALNVCYDYDYILHGKPEEEVFVSAYDVLVNESSVCHGYSLSCMALLQAVDIPCVFVRSPNHAWNMAYNGERWILFDTTWIASGRLEYGVLEKSDRLWYDWYDFTIEDAIGDKNHTIDTLDLMIADGTLTRFPQYTQIRTFEVPDEVTKINDYVFLECDSLKKVVIPDSVVDMGDYVFFDCDELECVILGNNVNSIGYAAFCYCDSLEKVNIPEKVKSIGYSAFCGCEELEAIIIPDSVESIGEQAFANCYELAEIEIGDGVVSIGNLAFGNCNRIESIIIGDGVKTLDHWYFGKALENIVIGDGVEVIEDYAFFELDKLRRVVIGQGVKSIGYASFYCCTALGKIELQEGLISIGDFALYGCSALTEIQIPDSVKNIGYQAFTLCSCLKDVQIGDGVTSIPENAFYGCSSLVNLSLGKNVKTVNRAAFYKTNIKNVYYTGSKEDWNSISFDFGNDALRSAKRNYVSNTSIECTGSSFKVECKNIPETGYDLFICSYANGRLKKAYMCTVKEITDKLFTLNDDVDTVKVFVLGSNGSLVPVSAEETLKI